MEIHLENIGKKYNQNTIFEGVNLILKENPNIDKCLFVVDRKDLDRQTRQEFNKFQRYSNIEAFLNYIHINFTCMYIFHMNIIANIFA